MRYRAESQALTGDDRVRGLTLKDGTTLPCDMFLGAIGIRPNVDLAREAGITVNRGVVVDDRMATSVPGIFAVGDVAEHDGMSLGLWPIAAKQGEVAAVNALGGDAALTAEVPATILKGVGLDLFSIGRVEARPGDEVITDEDPNVLGSHPGVVAAVTAAVKNHRQVSRAQVTELRRGYWEAPKDASPLFPLSGA